MLSNPRQIIQLIHILFNITLYYELLKDALLENSLQETEPSMSMGATRQHMP